MNKVLFIHRSVGRNLIKYGKLYELLEPLRGNVEFSDYDHNSKVLSSQNSHKKLGYTFPGNNTYPANLAELFDSNSNKYTDVLEWIGKYDTVALKSCYPTTKIKSDEALETLKGNYHDIAAYFEKTGQKLILLTPPPMRPILTRRSWATRSRQLAKWLCKTDFGNHVEVFDLFSELAEEPGQKDANTLRKQYRRPLFYDAHPNRKANLKVAKKFADFIGSLS